MSKIKHLPGIFCLLLLGIGISACLEKEPRPEPIIDIDPTGPFAHYRMNVTFIDALSKEPIPDLEVLLLGYGNQTVQTTDASGRAQLNILAHPPTPRIFELSYLDPQKNYASANFQIAFTNPVFKITSESAFSHNPLYQGLAEINITKELNTISR